MPIVTVNPFTEETIQQYQEMPRDEVEATVLKCHKAFLEWRWVPVSERAEKLNDLARLLRKKKKELSSLITTEMGKPMAQAESEIEKCAWVCEYYASEGPRFLASEVVKTESAQSYVTFDPLGVILAVMPWNFPFWQFFRFGASALVAGNGILLKHAPNTTGCGLAIEKLARDAGLPENLVRALIISVNQTHQLIAHPLVKAVTFTGSTQAGKSVAAAAGSHLKKTVLELGGSDPYLILEDADLDEAARTCVASRLINSGQSCIAAKRFVVVEKVLAPFTERVVDLMKAKRFGDPMDPSNDLGPMARKDLREHLHRQVQESIDAGARVLLGGEIPEQKGFFYPPTVLLEVRKGMPAFDQEIFGPVACIVVARDESEAVAQANDSCYGLGAAVFSRDLRRAERIAQELEAGCCAVNTFVKSDPRLPFGGIKLSGYGRELSHFGIREFVNIKTVIVA